MTAYLKVKRIRKYLIANEYRLSNQSLKYIHATKYVGNERVRVLLSLKPLHHFKNSWVYVAILLSKYPVYDAWFKTRKRLYTLRTLPTLHHFKEIINILELFE